jgi:hypothetical protein
MISLTNETIVNELTFICRNLEKATITSPNGRTYSLQRVERQGNTYVPYVDLGVHCAPLKCMTLPECWVFVGSQVYMVKHVSKEFLLDGQLYHDTMYHPAVINQTVIEKFKEFAALAK